MKKDIEWLKKEIEEYLEYEGVRDARIALESVLGYIDQLDEPEKVVIPKFVADWIESYRKKTLVELINDAVYSSDEDSKCFRRWFHEEMGFESNYSEFLSRAWLDGFTIASEDKQEVEENFYTFDNAKKWLHDNGFVVFEKDKLDEEVQRMVDETYEATNEKPVIPQFVADWIESYRKKTLVELINDAVYSSDEDSKCFRRWFHEEMGFESNYSEFLARAWLDGFTVEKEKVYIIEFAPSIYGTSTYGSIGTQNGKKIMQSVYGSQEGMIVPNQYTRREIEEVGSKYMAFAEEVVE